MRVQVGQWGLAGSVGTMILIGLLIEAVAGEVVAPQPVSLGGGRFVERAAFCPPSLPNTKTILAAASSADEAIPVGIEPTLPHNVALRPDQLLVHQPAGREAVNVAGFGAPIYSGALIRAKAPVGGEASGNCADRAGTKWYFAAGSSTLAVDERILIYNPFPDEAVARVSFLTATGDIAKASLDDVAVPARSAAFVRVNRYVRLQRVLAGVVQAQRGRIVAWKVLFDDPDGGPSGVQMSLGADRAAPTWYFPEGAVEPGIETRIAIANPTAETEATVTVSLVTGDEVVQPKELVELAIPPRSARVIPLEFSLPKKRRDLGGLSVIVQSTNGTGIVAERTMRYDRGPVHGSTSELGAPTTGERWLVAPATLNPSTDTLVVMNPGEGDAIVDIRLLRAGKPAQAPRELAARTIPSGGRLKIGLGPWTAGTTTALLVTSDQPVVVERVSYTAIVDDVGSVMGMPLR